MGELRRRLRLAEEALADVGIERQLWRQELDRDAPVEAHVGGAIDDGHSPSADLRVHQVLGPDRSDEPVEQEVGHPCYVARRAPEPRALPTRPISSATCIASSTFSAMLNALLASDVMCWCICGLALSRIMSYRLFCSARAQGSSFWATTPRFCSASTSARRCRFRYASRRRRASLPRSSGFAALSSVEISRSSTPRDPATSWRDSSSSESASAPTRSASADAERATSAKRSRSALGSVFRRRITSSRSAIACRARSPA